MNKSPRQLVGIVLWYVVCAALAVVFAGPFVWMVSNSFKPSDEIFADPPILISQHASFDNYREVFKQAPFERYMLNSFIVATTVTSVALLLHAMAGYALARLTFPGRNLIFIGIISTLMIPFYTILIPLSLLVKELGWFNTYLALIVPAIPHAFGIFWLRQFFLGIPGELEDAARIDGASRVGVFFRIALPLARPVLAALSVFFFLANWDSFLWPLIAANKQEMRVVQVGIQSFTGERGIAWHLIMAASVVAVIPTLFLFFTLQRFIVQSAKLSGLKG
ncbi:MAG: carbohydrate ABC transporter permease [Anaerolineae bacterium]|jgi:multiple sugar transport system permease protein|nr:carbohydrate ABC transporter permease [Anaerolineae bacterium]